MTKKHFIRLAQYMRIAEARGEPFTTSQLDHLADFCGEMNPRFNRELWLNYVRGLCGPGGGKK